VGFTGSEGVARYLFFTDGCRNGKEEEKVIFDPGLSYASDKKIDTFSEGRH